MTNSMPDGNRATHPGWVARFSDPDIPAWFLHHNGATFGPRDYGHIVGATNEPGTGRLSLRWSEMTADDLTGRFPVARDRFTGRWLTWPSTVESVQVAPPREERTVLDGGEQPLPPGCLPEQVEQVSARALADDRASLVLPFRFSLTLDDGTSWVVPPSGVTPDGLLTGFTTVERPRVMTGWGEVLDLAMANGDLSGIAGLVPVTHRGDWTGPWMLGAGVERLRVLA